MEYKILEWNINQATDIYGKNSIPDFVKNELINKGADIVILTEFYFCKNAEIFIKEAFDDYGYDYRFTHNKKEKENEVLIAWKKELFEFESEEVTLTTKYNNKPNFLMVHLKTSDGIKIVVAGLRITMKSYKERKEQMIFALEQLKKHENVIMGGDFNNLRRETTVKEWNLKVIEDLCHVYKFNTAHTPEGQSIYQEQGVSLAYEFAEDHFITKGNSIKMKEYHYDRGFTKDNPDIYLFEGNFQVYNNNINKVTWSIPFGSGIPDHAIILGKFVLDE